MIDVAPGKAAFITGGAIGFGRAFARALAGQGWTVALADIDGKAADRTVAALKAEGLSTVAVPCDVADDDEVAAAVEEVVRRVGDIGILINNAGKHLTKYNQLFGKLTIEEIRTVFDVNVLGIVRCSMACRDSMRQRGGGSIVNIASIAGYQPVSPYGVSKLAVRGLTIALATEFSADNIRVNAVAPGLTATESALADLPQSLVDEFITQRQLVHRVGQVDDVVSAVLYLCSDAASFVTGETLKVSGGYPLAV